MRNFIMTYYSEDNLFKGHLHICANTVADAQDKFLKWLRDQPTYAHLWKLNFRLLEIEGSLQ